MPFFSNSPVNCPQVTPASMRTFFRSSSISRILFIFDRSMTIPPSLGMAPPLKWTCDETGTTGTLFLFANIENFANLLRACRADHEFRHSWRNQAVVAGEFEQNGFSVAHVLLANYLCQLILTYHLPSLDLFSMSPASRSRRQLGLRPDTMRAYEWKSGIRLPIREDCCGDSMHHNDDRRTALQMILVRGKGRRTGRPSIELLD